MAKPTCSVCTAGSTTLVAGGATCSGNFRAISMARVARARLDATMGEAAPGSFSSAHQSPSTPQPQQIILPTRPLPCINAIRVQFAPRAMVEQPARSAAWASSRPVATPRWPSPRAPAVQPTPPPWPPAPRPLARAQVMLGPLGWPISKGPTPRNHHVTEVQAALETFRAHCKHRRGPP